MNAGNCNNTMTSAKGLCMGQARFFIADGAGQIHAISAGTRFIRSSPSSTWRVPIAYDTRSPVGSPQASPGTNGDIGFSQHELAQGANVVDDSTPIGFAKLPLDIEEKMERSLGGGATDVGHGADAVHRDAQSFFENGVHVPHVGAVLMAGVRPRPHVGKSPTWRRFSSDRWRRHPILRRHN